MIEYNDLSKNDKRLVKRYVVPIYRWIESHKHEYKDGVKTSRSFSQVVPRFPRGDETTFPALIRPNDADYASYTQLIYRLRRKGFLKFNPLEVGGKPVWSVNESILPPGVVTYTGVSYIIPLEEKPVSPVVAAPDEAELAKRGEKFVLAELKSIKVEYAILYSNLNAQVELKRVSLYDIYKLGLALQETLGTTTSEEPTGTISEAEPEEDTEAETSSVEDTLEGTSQPEPRLKDFYGESPAF